MYTLKHFVLLFLNTLLLLLYYFFFIYRVYTIENEYILKILDPHRSYLTQLFLFKY